MSEAWDGRPANPERDGPYALEHPAIWGGAMWWSGKAGYWMPPGSSATFTPAALVKCYPGVRYLGPCQFLAEAVVAQREAAWRAIRDAGFGGAAMDAAIRALQPPADLAAATVDAVAQEREACAALVEAEGTCRHVDHVQGFCACADKAAAIRARGGSASA